MHILGSHFRIYTYSLTTISLALCEISKDLEFSIFWMSVLKASFHKLIILDKRTNYIFSVTFNFRKHIEQYIKPVLNGVCIRTSHLSYNWCNSVLMTSA
jgi:hypothetical protein